MSSARTGAAIEIRKVRKKLRQIENLERLDRELTDEELNKILKKNSLRENLLRLLADHGEEESFTSSTRSDLTDDSVQAEVEFSYNYNENASYQDVSLGEVTILEPEDETNTDIIDIDIMVDVDEDEEVNKTTDANGITVEEDRPKIEKSKVIKPEKNSAIKTESPSPSKKSKKITVSDTKQKNPVSDTKTADKQEKPSKLKSTFHSWKFGQFEVNELEGHNDLVTDVQTDGRLMVTSSRDTTVKLWSVETLMELRSYGGHNSTVTCVQLLSEKESSAVCKHLELPNKQRVILSGSYDCSFKVWSTEASGEALLSVYTFNPVTKVIYHPVADVIITGSEGGKLEVWDISTGENIQSIHPYEDSVTGLKFVDGYIYSSSADGLISVHNLHDNEFTCLFMSENIRCENHGHLTQRHVRGFDVQPGLIYYGDDGSNIKVLDWKKGTVTKLVNHCEEFGVTDSICCHGDVMVSSAYSIDSGIGYINVRYIPDKTYISTLNDKETGRIVALSYAETGNRKVVVLAGMQLKVWISFPENLITERDKDLLSTQYLAKLARRMWVDSDVESEIETTDSESDDEDRINSQRHKDSTTQNKGWMGWCNII